MSLSPSAQALNTRLEAATAATFTQCANGPSTSWSREFNELSDLDAWLSSVSPSLARQDLQANTPIIQKVLADAQNVPLTAWLVHHLIDLGCPHVGQLKSDALMRIANTSYNINPLVSEAYAQACHHWMTQQTNEQDARTKAWSCLTKVCTNATPKWISDHAPIHIERLVPRPKRPPQQRPSHPKATRRP